MRRTIRIAALAVAVCFPGSAFAQPISYGRVLALPAPPPTHRIAYGTDSLQFGNLRLPSGNAKHPLVIFIHGGCFRAQYSIDHVKALEQAIADSGYAVWSIEYRRVGNSGGGWPGTFNDVARGVDYVRALAAKFPVDTNRIVVSGHSAGGTFALWVAARNMIRRQSPLYVHNPLTVHGVLALAPLPDLRVAHATGGCAGAVEPLAGGTPQEVPANYADISPATYAPIPVKQSIFLGAFDDSFRKYGEAYARERAAARDSMVTLVIAPESGHFDMVAPTTSTWTLVMKELRALLPARPD